MSMNDTISYLKQMWNGERFPSDKAKFTFISYVLGVVHIILSVIFFYLSYLFLGCYHFLTAYFYIVTMTVWLKNDKYFRALTCAYVEILLTSCLMTVTLGWNWGFPMYIIAICPVSFFVSYSLPGMARTLNKPFIFSSISTVVFIFLKVFVSIVPPYAPLDQYVKLTAHMYMFNCLLTFVSIIIFSAMFALEIRTKEIELEKHNKVLTDISSIDPLTKLLNRRSMGECLDLAVDKVKTTGELFTLAIGDIDNFKMVNDVHGHNVGDDVLKMVASTIRETLPKNAILCRWGGEEFLVLLRKTETEAISDIEAVRYAISQKSVKVEKPDGYIDLGVTMTFGMSQYIHGFTIDQVISLADENLYKGKANGKNRVVHSKTVL